MGVPSFQADHLQLHEHAKHVTKPEIRAEFQGERASDEDRP